MLKKSEQKSKLRAKTSNDEPLEEKLRVERKFVLPRRLNPKSWNFVVKY